MRLSYWLHDWRTRHLTAAEERVQAMNNLPKLPEHERMRIRQKPRTLADWTKKYGARKRA